MPDLKSQLADVKHKLSTMAFDDEGEAVQDTTAAPSAPTSISATTFNIIRDNPGCNRKRLMAITKAAGVGETSSSSFLAQFLRRGLIRAEDSPGGLIYFATISEYKPGYIKQAKKPTKAKKVQAPAVVAAAPAAPVDITVHDLLNTMSIVKARALYDELKKIFGA